MDSELGSSGTLTDGCLLSDTNKREPLRLPLGFGRAARVLPRRGIYMSGALVAGRGVEVPLEHDLVAARNRLRQRHRFGRARALGTRADQLPVRRVD